MRVIKSVITILTIVLFLGLSSSSCNDDSKTKSSDSTTSTTNEDGNKSGANSTNNIKAQITALSKECQKAITDVSAMQTSISQLQNKEKWLWMAFFGGIVALILSAITLMKSYELQKRASRQREDINSLIRRQQSSPQTSNNAIKTEICYKELQDRINTLEWRIKALIAQQQKPTPIVMGTPVKNETISKNGYFGVPIGDDNEPYFMKLLEAGDSDARFSVVITGDSAKFEPKENSSTFLGTIISSDAMRRAIDFVGLSPNGNPSSMKVIRPGEAVLKDSRWYIKNTAQILLS